jgi:ribonuclease D
MPLIEQYYILETEADLAYFQTLHQDISWISLDTEFIGERRYQTLLCIIQVASEKGLFIFDVLKLPHIQPLLQIIADPEVLIITHAGENDYRLIYELYNITPSNIFDTQIAAGFIGYKFPTSLRKLVEDELNIKIGKSQTVTNWEERPIKNKQIQYALEDVVNLYKLYQIFSKKIIALDRLEWVQEEFKKLEEIDYYEKEPYKEIFSHKQISAFSLKEQIFLLRLYEWRRKKAEERNHSKEMVLATKNITPIVKSMGMGIEGLRNNRRISEKFTLKYGEEMLKIYNKEGSKEEIAILNDLMQVNDIDPFEDIKLELLYNFIQYQCLKKKIAPELVLSRSTFKKIKNDDNYKEESLQSGWRREILGENLLNCLEHRSKLTIQIADLSIKLK